MRHLIKPIANALFLMLISSASVATHKNNPPNLKSCIWPKWMREGNDSIRLHNCRAALVAYSDGDCNQLKPREGMASERDTCEGIKVGKEAGEGSKCWSKDKLLEAGCEAAFYSKIDHCNKLSLKDRVACEALKYAKNVKFYRPCIAAVEGLAEEILSHEWANVYDLALMASGLCEGYRLAHDVKKEEL